MGTEVKDSPLLYTPLRTKILLKAKSEPESPPLLEADNKRKFALVSDNPFCR